MATEEKNQVGLECLDDETLAAIVDAELREHEELTVWAQVALAELDRRTPKS